MPPPIRLVGLGALLVLLSAPARAHDPMQSYTVVLPKEQTIEVEVVLSAANGRALIDHPPEVPITPENFDAVFHKLLLDAAPALLTLTTNGTALAPLRVTAGIDELYDLDFRFVYPRPAPGPIVVAAHFLKKLDESHMTHINVFDPTYHNLGDDDLSADNFIFEFKLPAATTNTTAAANSPQSPMPPAPAPAPPSGNSSAPAPGPANGTLTAPTAPAILATPSAPLPPTPAADTYIVISPFRTIVIIGVLAVIVAAMVFFVLNSRRKG